MAVATRTERRTERRQPTQKRQVKKRSRLAGRRPNKSRHLTYRHHSKTDRGYIQYPRQIDGRRPQETFPGKHGSPESRAAYEKSLAHFLAFGTLPPWIKQSTPPPEEFKPQRGGMVTVAQLCQEFLTAQGPGYSCNERAAYRVVIDRLCSLYGSTPVDEFTRRELRHVRQQMIARGNCRKYIDSQVTRIRGMFAWGVDEDGLVPDHIPAGLKSLRRLKAREAPSYPPRQPVADAVVAQTLPHLPREAADLVQLLRLSAARPSELMGLKACDIIQTRPDLWEYHPAEHKTVDYDYDRCIYFGPQAIEILQRLIGERGQRALLLVQPDWEALKAKHSWDAGEKLLRLYQEDAWKTHRTWTEYLKENSRQLVGLAPSRAQAVFRRAKLGAKRPRSKAGQPWNRHRFAQLIQRTCQKHGIEHWTPYQLRHAAACQAVQHGSLAAAQRILGHKLATTTDHYLKGDHDGAARLVAQLG